MEVELKLHVDPTVEGGPSALFDRLAVQRSLAGLPLGSARPIAVRDLYYDTAGGELARGGAGLRLRIEDETALVTLKITRQQNGAISVREELEEPLTPAGFEQILRHARPLIGDQPVPYDRFAAGSAAGPLVPVLETVTERLARRLGDAATLTLDRVTYPGVTEQVYWDIEAELLNGGDQTLLRRVEEELFALAQGRLVAAVMSKLERGLRLRAQRPE